MSASLQHATQATATVQTQLKELLGVLDNEDEMPRAPPTAILDQKLPYRWVHADGTLCQPCIIKDTYAQFVAGIRSHVNDYGRCFFQYTPWYDKTPCTCLWCSADRDLGARAN